MTRDRKAAPRLLPALVLAACLLVFLGQCWWHRAFTVDDAYISLRYARNLVEGHGLVFNEGERVEGYSNLLWVLLATAALKLGLPAVPALKLLGVLAGAGVILLSPLLMGRLTKVRGYATLWAAFALAVFPSLAYWSVGGLETTLFAFLLTAALLVWLGAERPGRAAAAGVLMALASFTRPEGPLFLVVPAALRWWRERGSATRPVTAYVAACFALVLPWFAWRIWYYGHLLPNTFYIKSGGWWPPIRPGGVFYVETFLSAHPGLAFWVVLPLLAAPALYLVPRALEVIVAVIIYALWVAKVGDWMPEYRFFVPLAPILAVISCAAAVTLWRRHCAPETSPRRSVLVWSAGLIVLLGLLHVASFSALHRGSGGSPDAVARRAATIVRPGEPVAVTDAGLIPYLTRCRTFDMIGLVSPEVLRVPIVRLPFARSYQGKRVIPVRAGVVDMVLTRRPALIQTHVGEKGGKLVGSHPLDQLFLSDRRLQSDYLYDGDGLFVRRDIMARRMQR